MKLLIAGGDMRYAYLACQAADRFEDVAAIGLEKSGLTFPMAELEDIRAADAVLMPNPWRGVFPAALSEAPLRPEDVLSRLGPGAALILPDTIGMPESFEAPWLSLSGDEYYMLGNAFLTAEGAIHAAMSAVPFALDGTRALVIGYGRIARRLAELLMGLGCEVTVCARRDSALDRALGDGAIPCTFEQLPARIDRYQLIFSTPPATVLDDYLLGKISPGALLMDLASPPFGFSLSRALEIGCHAVRENNLPGRYCPESAGKIMLDAVLAALGKGGFT